MKRLWQLSGVIVVVVSLAVLASGKAVTNASSVNELEASSPALADKENQDLRSQFMERVNEEQDIGKQKERLIQNYLDLTALMKKQGALRAEFETKRARLVLEPSHYREAIALQSHMTILDHDIAAEQIDQRFIVRTYGLLLQLEQLETLLKSRAITREEYRQEKHFLLDRLGQVDQLRHQLKQGDDLLNKLEEVGNQLSQLKR